MAAHFSSIASDLGRTVAQGKMLLVQLDMPNTAVLIQKHLADRKESYSPLKK